MKRYEEGSQAGCGRQHDQERIRQIHGVARQEIVGGPGEVQEGDGPQGRALQPVEGGAAGASAIFEDAVGGSQVLMSLVVGAVPLEWKSSGLFTTPTRSDFS